MPRDGEQTGRRVVAFARPARIGRRERSRLPDETGQILLFTGVRYQRDVEMPPADACRPPDPERSPGDARIGG